ncbi:MAG: restriction endonuclease subunit S [Actinomycetota bacterium]|nr:restriction endonuclease subunit S [Actinomycetota bacterium]
MPFSGGLGAEKVIDAARELKKSLMCHLFTYGPVPYDQINDVPLKETEIGPVPEHWRLSALGDIVNIRRGASPRPKGNPRYFAKKGIHWIKISDLRKYQRGKFLAGTDEFLTEEGKRKSFFVEAGTLLLTNSGTVGKPVILGIDGCIHDGYLALLEPNVDKNYLYYLLEKSRKKLIELAPRCTQPNLNTMIVKAFRVPLPPIPEQQQIARILQTVDRKIEAEENRKRAIETL